MMLPTPVIRTPIPLEPAIVIVPVLVSVLLLVSNTPAPLLTVLLPTVMLPEFWMALLAKASMPSEPAPARVIVPELIAVLLLPESKMAIAPTVEFIVPLFVRVLLLPDTSMAPAMELGPTVIVPALVKVLLASPAMPRPPIPVLIEPLLSTVLPLPTLIAS